ncbi:MAG: F0F1 ATP synthase subunit delta, partial [Oscillospiraceae bacterium]|nr:F0F1 ATP synthase subunit delta [Oscillospiraceae bacterium]
MTQTVGKVYAEALFQLAKEEHQEKKIYEELNQVADLLQSYPDFVLLLDVPTLDMT